MNATMAMVQLSLTQGGSTQIHRSTNGVGQGFKNLITQALSENGETTIPLKDLIKDDLAQLLTLLKNGQFEGLPKGFTQDLISKLQEWVQLNGNQFQEALAPILSELNEQLPEMKNDQALEMLGALVLQHVEMNQQMNNHSNLPTMNKSQHQNIKLLAQIMIALFNGQNVQKSSETTIQSFEQQLPKQMVTKWEALLTQMRQMLNQSQQTTTNMNNNLISPEKINTLAAAITQILNKNQSNNRATNHTSNFNNNQYQQGIWSSITNNRLTQSTQPVESTQMNTWMSKPEQFVIYMSRPSTTHQAQSNQQNMIEQLQKIVESSKFTQMGGQKSLSIQLKPANLGEMMLKFTQIDGQMTVKITVMTQAAKEMLEGNLQQLRHMFSPNQVVIERQTEQPQASYQQSFSEEESQQSNHQSSEQNHDESDSSNQQHSGEKSFKDYLFEEEV